MLTPDSSETLRLLAEVLPKEWKATHEPAKGHWSASTSFMGITSRYFAWCKPTLRFENDAHDEEATMLMLDYLESLGWGHHAFQKTETRRAILITHASGAEMYREGSTRSECVALALLSAVQKEPK